MPFPRMLGLGRNPNPQTGHTPNMWAHDFTAYKQAPKRTGKMKILSRNFISVSIAQKVPASISKQPPPSNRWDKQQAISASAPGAVETQWRPRRRQNLPSSVTQPRRSGTVLRGRHVLPAGRQGSTAHPGLEVLLGQPGHSAAPGRENWSDCTSKSLPQSHLANRQLRGLIGKIWKQGGDWGGRGKPVRQAMADKQKLHKHAREKDQNLQKSRTSKKEEMDQRPGEKMSWPVLCSSFQVQYKHSVLSY